jgi:hypothetical protein
MFPPEIPSNTHELTKLYLREAVGSTLELSVKIQENFSHGNPILSWIYQYLFLNIMLAKPTASVVCTKERVNVLKANGLDDSKILGLLSLYFALDHVVPTSIMLAADAEYASHAQLPSWFAPFAGFLTARLVWGVSNGLFQAGVFSILSDREKIEKQAGQSQDILDLSVETNTKFGALYY